MNNKKNIGREFVSYSFSKELLLGINEAEYTHCTNVQEKTFEFSLQGRDVTVMSQTGTGKTAAFLLSVFSELQNLKKNKRALILAPTRELAIQIEKEAKLLGKHLNLKIGSFYGGVGYNSQELLLKKNVDIVIGTPGRILDFINTKKLILKDFGFLVIDEADRLFDMGFYPDIQRIIRKMPSKDDRQTMMFSATLNNEARMIVRNFMNNPEKVEITPEVMVVNAIAQTLYHIGSSEKFNFMLGIIKRDVPKNILVFTNTKNEAERISKKLEHNGYKSAYLIGDLKQSTRTQTINNFKEGKLQILVATDVAARGLHIDDLEMVVNYDLPNEAENYVHRIGRTARAGKTGKAISFGCEKFIYNLDAIETLIGDKIPVKFAEDDYFVEGKVGFNEKKLRHPKGGKPVKKGKTSYKNVRSDKIDKNKDSKNDKNRKNTDKGKKIKNTQTIAKSESLSKNKLNKKKKVLKPKLSTLDDRLSYYKKKYGEDFKVAGQDSTPATTTVKRKKKQKKQKIIKKILSFFKR